ncbi:DNA-directed RNA polymerase III complex subunit Rpc25 [Clarireedia jacksonii]
MFILVSNKLQCLFSNRDTNWVKTKIADLVQIAPSDLGKDASQAIEDNINLKYANKVIQKIGLCICFYDLLSASEGLIGHGDGLVNVNVEFRLIVFRPFKHEILTGRISSAVEGGIRLRTHFFDEIFVPANMLPEGSHFNHNEQIFVWINDGQEFFFDNQESVRFRVDSEEWVDQAPIGPVKPDNPVKKEAPYRIIASMEEVGLGPCLWWDG